MGRKKIKQRNLAVSEIKHFVRSHVKNIESVIIRAHDEGASVLGEKYSSGIAAGATKKGILICSEWTSSKV